MAPPKHRCRAAAPAAPPLLPRLLLLLATAAPPLLARPAAGLRWPGAGAGGGGAAAFGVAPTARQCRAAAGGAAPSLDNNFAPLTAWMGLKGGAAALPRGPTNITTLSTIVELATPGLKLVLDPLLYLEAWDGRGTAEEEEGVPLMIHMTMRDKQLVPPHQVLSILSWGRFNPGYALLMYDDSDMREYMARYHSEILATFSALETPVERADLWRYHVLCGHGGVYADTDTVCVAPFDEWLNRTQHSAAAAGREISGGGYGAGGRPGLVVGIENVFPSQEVAEEMTYVKKIQMIQLRYNIPRPHQMASKKGHPVPCSMGPAIRARIQEEAAAAAGAAAPGAPVAGPSARRALSAARPTRRAAAQRLKARRGAAAAKGQDGEGAAAAAAAAGATVPASGGVAPAVLGHDAAILLRTGPGIWTDAVHKYMRDQGSTPEDLVLGGRVGDAAVLPQLALGCGVKYWSPDNMASLVYHMYNNSWKVDHFSLVDARRAAHAAAAREETLQTLGLLLVLAGAGAAVAAAAYAAVGLVAPGWAYRRRKRPEARND
ncbi:MAG: hypothetical protein J3K34DRAFT_459880 [Monoraphidium minutum]|nr:MAG: hypothetical protein J3K34DRAFT_459880 [Monoraphidium minutum]